MRCLPRVPPALLALALLTNLGVAQESAPQLPDTPSTTKQAEKKPAKKALDFKILARKSKLFPDLAASNQPLLPKQKFQLFISDSVSPAAFLGAAFGAGIGQARDSLPGYGQGAEGYGKRFGASLATGASAQFFGTFLLPSLLRQDPRFFVRGTGSLLQSVRYGLRRLVITRADAGGDVINWSGLVGPLAAQGLANTYLPDDERTAAKTFQRYGTYLALRAGVNVAKEYWPTISKKLTKPKKQKK